VAAHLHHEPRPWASNRRSNLWQELARTAAPYVAASILLIAIGLVDWRLGAFLGAAALALGTSWGLIWLVRRSRERTQADRWIRGHRYLQPTPDLVARRAAELTAPKMRRLLATSLRNAVRKSQRRAALSASPLNSSAVRDEALLVGQLADRLADLEQPVNARGVLLTQDLLTHGGSPLYGRATRQELESALLSVLAALENGR
jgi:hypothetical protein